MINNVFLLLLSYLVIINTPSCILLTQVHFVHFDNVFNDDDDDGGGSGGFLVAVVVDDGGDCGGGGNGVHDLQMLMATPLRRAGTAYLDRYTLVAMEMTSPC